MPGKDLDHSASAAAFFGAELRIRREALSWSQRELGEKANISPSRIAQIELASIPATLHNATALDVALATGGFFARLFDLVAKAPVLANWFQDYVRLETLASSISGYAPALVPGLLQTERYARALLQAGRLRSSDEEVEARVQARIGRQAVLASEKPPALWFVLEEAVLKRSVGGEEVMREQLDRLIELLDHSTVALQVVPENAVIHPALGGTLNVLTFPDRAAAAYVEGAFAGQLFEEPEQVTDCALAYDYVQTAALSPQESAAVIRNAWEAMRP